MSHPVRVSIPLVNPNEPEALLAALHVAEGQLVAVGDLLCTLETTKSAADVAAEAAGYVVGLRLGQGQTVRAGETLCYLAESPESRVEVSELQATPADETGTPSGLRITQPALALARQEGLDLSQLPTDVLITESLLRSTLQKQAGGQDFSPPPTQFDPAAILVYGGGGHGKSVIDMLRLLGVYRVVAVVDDGLPDGESIMGVPVVGGAETLTELFARGVRLAVNAVGGIGSVAIRMKVFRRLAETGFGFPVVIHPTAFVEPSAVLAPGGQVFPHAYVGSEARVGFGTIVNTGAIVSHDCLLGDYVNVSPGAMLAGAVEIGSGTLVGMGVTINLGVTVGAGARIGNGATVKADVPQQGIVRAGSIWPD